MERKRKGLSTPFKFLLTILAVYLVAAVIDPLTAQTAIIDFLKMFTKILPILGVVFVIMTLVNLYFTEERTRKILGQKSGVQGWIYTIITSVFMIGPPFVLYPILGTLKKRGMKDSLLAAMLYNKNITIYFMPVMVYYFGLKFTIIISIYIILFSVITGKFIEKIINYGK
ncbi:MAG: hypothetical protein KOO64_09230 [Desulfobacterales bacterium]|nr:hypothetical protein [Desulfobacterales bacterium]